MRNFLKTAKELVATARATIQKVDAGLADSVHQRLPDIIANGEKTITELVDLKKGFLFC